MTAPGLGPWRPLTVESVAETFASATFRWWVSGGHALELHMWRRWRDHDDTDIGVVRSELPAVYALLADWDVHVAADGQLTPWRGEALAIDRHQNNLWCRYTARGPWILDITVGEGSVDNWIYRRDPSVQLPWSMAVLRSADAIPYLAPELQLLYKSKSLRPKDNVDAAEVIPSLDARQRGFLARLVGPATTHGSVSSPEQARALLTHAARGRALLN